MSLSDMYALPPGSKAKAMFSDGQEFEVTITSMSVNASSSGPATTMYNFKSSDGISGSAEVPYGEIPSVLKPTELFKSYSTQLMDWSGKVVFPPAANWKPSDSPVPDADLSQIESDLVKLSQAASVPSKPSLSDMLLKTEGLKAMANFEGLKASFVAADEQFAALTQGMPNSKDTKPLSAKLGDLMRDMAWLIQNAPPHELKEVLKYGVMSLGVPLAPELSTMSSASLLDELVDPPTIKTLHIKLEISE